MLAPMIVPKNAPVKISILVCPIRSLNINALALFVFNALIALACFSIWPLKLFASRKTINANVIATQRAGSFNPLSKKIKRKKKKIKKGTVEPNFIKLNLFINFLKA